MSVAQLLLQLIAIFAAAKLFGEIAERIGQPAVVGELVGGIVVGVSGLKLVNPAEPTIHLLAELGVILLLFLIGLETDLKSLIEVGAASTSVACVGVAVPFALGYLAGRMLGYPMLLSLFLGATLTATSVGITARVLSDLGHLDDREARVILGAAVIDDILGIIILVVLDALVRGEKIGVASIAKTATVAFGFVIVAVVVGTLLAPQLVKLVARLRVAKALFFASIMFAFALAWAAEAIGSAMIIGSFAAGLVLARTEHGKQIAHEVYEIAQFFVPIFFVSVGAAIDLRTLNPFDPVSRPYVLIGVLLAIVAIVGKLVSGWAAVGRGYRRIVIGVGMIPRGEVGLIFAQIGLASGLLSRGLYSSVALMVIATTFVAPPWLRALLGRAPAMGRREAPSVVFDAFRDDEDASDVKGTMTADLDEGFPAEIGKPEVEEVSTYDGKR